MLSYLASVSHSSFGEYEMASDVVIRILASGANEKGDLFGRLMGDFFLALGYGDVRLNIHKTGREIDLEAHHRTEPLMAIAECKATRHKVGGDAINKFVGVLDAERHKRRKQKISGYFVSLAGFKETAIEQEQELGSHRLILVDGRKVVEELVHGNIIVSSAIALEQAGRCAAMCKAKLRPDPVTELLAHSLGWFWAIYYLQGGKRSHYALVHADGKAIGESLAKAIIESDALISGLMRSLTFLPSPSITTYDSQSLEESRKKYFEYLEHECTYLPLEGLPAAEQVGPRWPTLEDIAIPLHLESLPAPDNSAIGPQLDLPGTGKRATRKSVGTVLSDCTRLTILGPPGSGKSTLLKRIALAYAFPERRERMAERLPDRNWLPLFVRCRQLGSLAKSSIIDVLNAIPSWAEMTGLNYPFQELIRQALHSGQALLLIDGLDEISNESARSSFALQLRTFLATYSNISIIVTSREPGFRLVAGVFASQCRSFRIAEFNNTDIERVTIAWHKVMFGTQMGKRRQGQLLAKKIIKNERIRDLARNPLLLTMLLLVNRWLGQLPSRRALLYGKAVEVLLATWNIEGYEPLDPEEVVPQLAFIAFTMMREGVQRISAKHLRLMLQDARSQMPEILAFARIGVSDFINRVEARSSLLMLTGHEIEDGVVCPMYEFRHLAFQEYFAAVSAAEGFYPNSHIDDDLSTVLEPYLEQERWQRVIPLAVALTGRRAEPLLRCLVDRCKNFQDRVKELQYEEWSTVNLLVACIADEVRMAPPLLEEALTNIICLARKARGYWQEKLTEPILTSRYFDVYAMLVKRTFFEITETMPELAEMFGRVAMYQIGLNKEYFSQVALLNKCEKLLRIHEPADQTAGCLAAACLAKDMVVRSDAYKLLGTSDIHGMLSGKEEQLVDSALQSIKDSVEKALESDVPQVQFAACFALVQFAKCDEWTPRQNHRSPLRLVWLWKNAETAEVSHAAANVIAQAPLVNRTLKPFGEPSRELIEFIKSISTSSKTRGSSRRWCATDRAAALILGFYWREPWDDSSLEQMVEDHEINGESRLGSMLRALSTTGKKRVAERSAMVREQYEHGLITQDELLSEAPH